MHRHTHSHNSSHSRLRFYCAEPAPSEQWRVEGKSREIFTRHRISGQNVISVETWKKKRNLMWCMLANGAKETTTQKPRKVGRVQIMQIIFFLRIWCTINCCEQRAISCKKKEKCIRSHTVLGYAKVTISSSSASSSSSNIIILGAI